MSYDDYWNNMYSDKLDKWRREQDLYERRTMKYEEIKQEVSHDNNTGIQGSSVPVLRK